MRNAISRTEEGQLLSISVVRFGFAGFVVAILTVLILLWLLTVPTFTRSTLLFDRTRGLWVGGVLLVTVSLATFLLQRFMLRPLLQTDRAWPYRLSFLLSAGLGTAAWVYYAPLSWGPLLSWQLACIVGGSFLGGLLSTELEEGLSENTFKPSPYVEEEVLRHHRALLSQPSCEPGAKRLFDVVLALAGLLLSAPFWIVSAFLIWFEDPGPIFFVKNSVGKGGFNFQQIKFRSMIRNAEAETGPIPVREKDQRVLFIGRFLRKSALDELPQLINVLRGEMSFVGPRPLRTVVIHDYLKELPQFAERHQVRPGIAGLSQVLGGYYLTPLQRLRFDRVYVKHISLWLDLKILLMALVVVFWQRWGKEGDRHTPRY